MHTTILEYDSTLKISMNHNSDFSGDVIILRAISHCDPERWTIPGSIIQAIREHAVGGVLDWLSEFPLCDVEVMNV